MILRLPNILILFGVLASCTHKKLPEGAIELPKKIDETSGLASLDNYFLTLNDSGGKATLYAFNKEGKRLEKYKIDCVPVQFRHAMTLAGGIHCATLDLRRKGSLESYCD